MKNQDPERYERRTNVNLKTDARENLFKNPSSPVYKMQSPDSKTDYYFGVVGKHYPPLIWQETGNYSPDHHSTLCKVQSADSADSRGFLFWSVSPRPSVKQKQAALTKLIISRTQREVGNNRNTIIIGQNASILLPDIPDWCRDHTGAQNRGWTMPTARCVLGLSVTTPSLWKSFWSQQYKEPEKVSLHWIFSLMPHFVLPI